MNKKSVFILCICLMLILVLAVLVSGCNDKKLSAPRDMTVVDGEFVWSEVEGADGYMIYFNDDSGDRFFTWNNRLSVDDSNIKNYLKSGKLNMLWVRAVKLDKYGIPDLDTQSDRTRLDFDYIRQLDKPARLSANNENSTLSWRDVEGAMEYYALIDGKEYKISHKTSDMGTVGTIKDLPNGSYNICIIAKGEGYLDSDKSESVDFVQNNISSGGNFWTVTFDLNYEGCTVLTAKAENNKAVDKPEEPTRIGYKFAGWYFDLYCKKEAKFTSTRSQFNITAPTRLYANWIAETITKTPIYFYTTDWAVAYAKIYKDDAPLFENNGVLLNAMDGKKGWFNANIDDRTTRIVFTDGGENELASIDFDKSKPYYKDGEWTAEMPIDTPDNPDIGQYIYVNGVKHNLKVNEDSEPLPNKKAEYMVTIKLEIGDVIEFKAKDGTKYIHYEPECNFTGTANVDGEYTFYVKIYDDGHSIWAEVPENDDPITEGIKVYYKNVNHWSAVYAYAWNDGGNAGAWPGNKMTAVEGHDDWFEISVPDGMTSIIFNGGSGKPQTGDLTIDKDNLYYNGYAWKNDFIEHTGSTTRTVYFYNDKGWPGVRAYAWTGGGEMSWPGLTMKAVEGKTGWYSIEIPLDLSKILFNSISDSETKTLDLELPTGTDDVYYKDGWVDSME